MNTDVHKNGCHNRPDYVANIEQQDGWVCHATRRMVMTPQRMAKDCQYTKTDLGKADKGCNGCKWKQGFVNA